jgi:hypothetical protein
MKLLKQAIHQALRDDSATTIGLRTLLGHAATPWGVYQAYFPEVPAFGTKHYVTWNFLSGSTTLSQSSDMRLREIIFSVTAWSESMDTLETIQARVRHILENLKKVTVPTSEAELHQILHEGAGPDLFDDEKKAYYRAETYRAFYREDITT